jgi:hypothetical protein
MAGLDVFRHDARNFDQRFLIYGTSAILVVSRKKLHGRRNCKACPILERGAQARAADLSRLMAGGSMRAVRGKQRNEIGLKPLI